MPNTDVEPDSEFVALAPNGVSVHVMRVRWLGVPSPSGALTRHGPDAARAFVETPQIDDAAEMLAEIRPDAITLAFTSSSYVLGPKGDEVLKARLEKRTQEVPVAITCSAAVSALRMFGVRRLALVPPLVRRENGPTRRGIQQQGFDVVYHARAPLRSDRGQIHPGPLYEWARMNVPKQAEAVFFGGNEMRTIGAIQALEETWASGSSQATRWPSGERCVFRTYVHVLVVMANYSTNSCRVLEVGERKSDTIARLISVASLRLSRLAE